MAKYVIQSKRGAPPQGAYSQGWRAGDFIFVTGTGPVDPATGKLVGDSIEEQTEQTIENLLSILEADGALKSPPISAIRLSSPATTRCMRDAFPSLIPCVLQWAATSATLQACWSNWIASLMRQRRQQGRKRQVPERNHRSASARQSQAANPHVPLAGIALLTFRRRGVSRPRAVTLSTDSILPVRTSNA